MISRSIERKVYARHLDDTSPAPNSFKGECKEFEGDVPLHVKVHPSMGKTIQKPTDESQSMNINVAGSTGRSPGQGGDHGGGTLRWKSDLLLRRGGSEFQKGCRSRDHTLPSLRIDPFP